MAHASRRPASSARLACLVVTVWALAGCGGLRKASVVRSAAADAADAPQSSRPTPAALAETREREERRELPQRIHAQVAARMHRHPAAVHQQVAGTVLAESSRAGMDPLLVLAVIHVESSFDPRAVSSAGAMGLMQVRGPTMREALGRASVRATAAFDPRTNVQAGVRYLRTLLDAFGGTDVALMAYNAGPNRMRELLARGKIPARVRAYPRKVMSELGRLRIALGMRPQAAGAAVADRRTPLAGPAIAAQDTPPSPPG